MRLHFGVFFLAFFLCIGAVQLPEYEHGQPLSMCDYVRKIHSDTLRFKEEWKRNVAELKKHMIPPEPHESWKDAMGMSGAEYHYLLNPPRGYMKEQNEYSLWINRMRLSALRIDENLPLIRELPEEYENDLDENISFMVGECDYLKDNENFNGPEPPLPGENGFFSDVQLAFDLNDLAYIPEDGGYHLPAVYPLDSQSDLIKKLFELLEVQHQSDKAKVEADYKPDDYTVTINEDTGHMHVEKSRDRILKDTQEDYIHTNSIGLQLHNIVHHGFHYAAEFSRGILERDNPIHYCAKSVFIAHKSLTRRYYYINFLGRNFPIGVFIPDERLRVPFEKCEKLPRSEQDKCMFAESHKCRNAECQPPYLDDENVEFSGDKTVVGVLVVYDVYEQLFENCMDIDGADLVECLSSEVAKVTKHEVKTETDLDVDNEFDESWYELIKRDCISKLGEEWWVSPSNVEGEIIHTPNSEGYKLQEWRAYCFQQYNWLQETGQLFTSQQSKDDETQPKTDVDVHYAASEGFIPNEKHERMFENCDGLTGAERNECFAFEQTEIRKRDDEESKEVFENDPLVAGRDGAKLQYTTPDTIDEHCGKLPLSERPQCVEEYVNTVIGKSHLPPTWHDVCEHIAQNGEWSDCNGETQVQTDWPRFCSKRRTRYCGTEDAELKNQNSDIWVPKLREKRPLAYRICLLFRRASDLDECAKMLVLGSLSIVEEAVGIIQEYSNQVLAQPDDNEMEQQDGEQFGVRHSLYEMCGYCSEKATRCIEDLKKFGRLTTREICENYLAPWIKWSPCYHNLQRILSETKICKDVHYRLCETEGMDPELKEMLDPKRSDDSREELMACWENDFLTQREEYYECVRAWAGGFLERLKSLSKLVEELHHSENEDEQPDASEKQDEPSHVIITYFAPSERIRDKLPKSEIDQPVEEVADPEPVIEEHRPCFRKEYEKLETWIPDKCDEQYLEDMKGEAAFLGNATENQGHNCSAELNRNAWNYAKNMMFCLYEVLPQSRAEYLPLVLKNVSRYPNVTSASEAVFLYVRYAAYKECNVFYIKEISKNFKGVMAQRKDNKAFYNDESLGNILTFCKGIKEINEIGYAAAVQLLRNILISKVIYESHAKPETLEENFERLVKYRSKKLPLIEESRSIYKNDAADNTVFDETMDPGDLFIIQKRCDMIEASINPDIDTIVELSKKPVPSRKQLSTLVDYWLDFVGNSDVDSDDPQVHLAEFSKILTGKYPQVCASYITFTVCVRLQIAFVGMTNQRDLEFKCNDLIASLKQ